MAKNWKSYSYLVLGIYLAVGFFLFPVIGSVALFCMLAPVVMAFSRGREWCGRYCPRGSLWDQVLARVNSRKTVPGWAKTRGFRILMLGIIFAMFGWQMVYAWPVPAKIGLVFLRIIFITTIIGMLLAVVYSPRTWCNFCPMGTLAAWASSGRNPLAISKQCVQCGVCARTCPMGLSPQRSGALFAHPDCIKCGICVDACPKQALSFVARGGGTLFPRKGQKSETF
ncbi:MAG: 4Fe-4S binding protein [Negativicutes bacterium]|nr:4Fe-4S binding protein [Negativicutes bacterium]